MPRHDGMDALEEPLEGCQLYNHLYPSERQSSVGRQDVSLPHRPDRVDEKPEPDTESRLGVIALV